MKKFLSIILCCAMLISMNAPAFADGGSADCEHVYSEAVTVSATCTAAGEKVFTCDKCGDSYPEAIEALDHSYDAGVCVTCGAEEIIVCSKLEDCSAESHEADCLKKQADDAAAAAVAEVNVLIDALPETVTAENYDAVMAQLEVIMAKQSEMGELWNQLNLTKLDAVILATQQAAALAGAVAKIGDTPYDTLPKAIAAAQPGETVVLLEDTSVGASDNLIDKAIVLDLGGKTLTTTGAYGGLRLKGGCSITNGTLIHSGATTAIKAWNVDYISNLHIIVNGTSANPIGGIVVQEGTEVRINSISNVTIEGASLTNGIETYNCGNASQAVIGSMENVTVDANNIGMIISAPCGTATNCTVSGGVSGIDLSIKGTYNASLTLVGGSVTGGTQAINLHDEYSTDPSIVNSGNLSLAESGTSFSGGTAMNMEVVRADNCAVETQNSDLEAVLAEECAAKVGNTYCTSITKAVSEAENGDTITLLEDTTEEIELPVGVTLDKNNHVAESITEAKVVAKVGELSYASVTEAINAAADGATVVILPGTIDEYIAPWAADSTHASEKSITIEGSEGTVLTGGLYLGYDDSQNRAHSITVKNITFKTKGVLVAGQANVIIENNVFENITECVSTPSSAGANAISVIGKNVVSVIRNNTINGTEDSGINLRDTKSATVTGNTVTNTKYNSITITVSDAENIVVSDNVMSEWGMSGTEGRAVRINGGNVTLTDNNMTCENQVEEVAKLSSTTAVDFSGNYWNGGDPLDSSVFISALGEGVSANEYIKYYYTDEEMTEQKRLVIAGSGTEEDPYLIQDVEDLLMFQKKVDEQAADGSTQFSGKYFKMTADIDLAGIAWNPIGSMSGDHGSFNGVFDGDNHTISNLNVEHISGNGLGLFAYTSGNAVIKNLNLANVTVKATDVSNASNGNYVGGLVGNAYASTRIENVHVSGNIDISGRGYIGGIAGHGYVVMDNVSVIGSGTISSTFWCAGGVLGYAGEGATNINNATVQGINISSAAGGLGAVVGYAEDNHGTQPIAASNLSASNVAISTYVGGYGTSYENYCIGYLCGGSEITKFSGTNTVSNVTLVNASGEVPPVCDAVAEANGTVCFDMASAIEAAKNGGTIKMLKDLSISSTITIPASYDVTIDLNGKTISQEKACTENYSMIVNQGNLTVTDLAGGGKISFDDTGAGDPSFGWGSYTLRNEGTLTVNAGTIEHLCDLNDPSVVHMYCAIFQYSGSTVVNGGTISTPTYRSVRLWKGDMVINGGTFEGQVWVQCVDDSAKLTINDGSFAPRGVDGSSVFIGNVDSSNTLRSAEVTVNGGTFETKIGANDAASLNGPIKGGKFSQSAIDGTNAGLIAEGYIFEGEPNEDGYYGVIIDPDSAVAKIGDVNYLSLQDALDAAAEGSTVTLLQDSAEDVVVSKDITIDTDGFTVNSVTVNDATLTVSAEDMADLGDAVTLSDAAIKLSDNLSAEMEDGTVKPGTNGGIIAVPAANTAVSVNGIAVYPANASASVEVPVSAEGEITVPAGSVVEFEAIGAQVSADNGGTVSKEGVLTQTPAEISDYGYGKVLVTLSLANGQESMSTIFVPAGNKLMAKLNNGALEVSSDAKENLISGEGDIDMPELSMNKTTQGFYKYGLSNLEFICNGFKDSLRSVSVDNKELRNDIDYTVKAGSTILTLKNSYLKELALGKHTLKLTYADGQTVAATINVVSTPITGDNSNPVALCCIMALSAVAMLSILAIMKKRKA